MCDATSLGAGNIFFYGYELKPGHLGVPGTIGLDTGRNDLITRRLGPYQRRETGVSYPIKREKNVPNMGSWGGGGEPPPLPVATPLFCNMSGFISLTYLLLFLTHIRYYFYNIYILISIICALFLPHLLP